MNSRHMIAAAALALMGATASASPSEFSDMPSTASRAEVLAEARADARGFRANDSYGSVDSANVASATTREEVLAELAAARASGEFDVRGEVYGDVGHTKFGNLPARTTVAAAEPALIVAYADIETPLPIASESASVITETTAGQVIDEVVEGPSLSEPLGEPLSAPIMPVSDTMPNTAILESSVTEPVVLWVPIDGEAVTLRPGEAVLLVPSDDAEAPIAE